MRRSYVVTGGGRGVGRAIIERLLTDSNENSVVVVELDTAVLTWYEHHLARSRVMGACGNASEESVAD